MVKIKYRTDLITEQQNIDNADIEGTVTTSRTFGDARLEALEVLTDEAASRLNIAKGKYYTVQFPKLESICDTSGIYDACIFALKSLIGEHFDNVMVVGLGNTDITPDALGPNVAGRILATRHLGNELKENLGLQDLKSVCCVIPGVLGKTGIEAFDTVNCVSKDADVSLIIVIDALAAISPERLCTTLQFTDTGIKPGSGVQNSRKSFSFADFGVPVIAVGMPTVIDAAVYGNKNDPDNMMVTPKDIDMLIDKASALLSDILNGFLQPALDLETVKCLT